MKRILYAVLISCSVLSASAQISVGTPEQLAQFFHTKTIVLLIDNPTSEYNRIMKEAVEKYWKLTPYEFVPYTKDEFNKIRMDTSLSFLKLSTVTYPNDDVKQQYYFLTVSLGGKYKAAVEMPEIASIPVCYVESQEDYFAYKAPMLLKFIINHIEIAKANPKLKTKKAPGYYKKQLPGLKQNTLYIISDELGKDMNENTIKSVYQHPVKIVSRDEAAKIIEKGDKNVAFIHLIGAQEVKKKGRCYKMAMNAGTGMLYSLKWHMINEKTPDAMTLKDFKAISK